MALIKCKMCGGDLAVQMGQSVAECEYCGSRQTVPTADNEKKLIQFERAERLRRNCEFDKAAGLYEAIVSEFRQEAEAYWGLVLCKYGIEYVDDPATGKKIPTCHRSSFHSILEDSDFEQAMENADEIALRVYREEAKQIERIRREILTVSSSEKPYDIFICYKETDSKGNRTVDSLLAQSIYDALTETGYRVFFSRITLEDKLGQAYEPYIFAALHSAKIMLAVGTCYENYNAVWVKNEWSRYLKIIAQDKNKYLIPCYKSIDPYDIPGEFAHLQGQDMGKVGAMADLLRGIEKLMPGQMKKTTVVQERVVIGGSEHTAPLLRRAKLFLEDRDWESADKYCEKVLDMEPENGEAWFCKLMAQFHVCTEEDLGKLDSDFLNSPICQKALRFGNDSVRENLENARKDTVYYAAKRQAAQNDKGAQNKSVYQAAIGQLGTIPGWRDAGKLILDYRAQIEKIEAREAAARQEKERQTQLAREQAEEKRKQAEKKAKQTKKLAKIAVPVISAGVALMILLNSLLPVLQGSGKPEATGATEAEVQEFPVQTQPPAEEPMDPRSQAYAAAEQLLADGETAKAAIAFGKLGDYADARQRSFALWDQVAHRDTVSMGSVHAAGLKNDGTVVVAGYSKNELHTVSHWNNIVAVSAGYSFIAALKADGTVVHTASREKDIFDDSGWKDIVSVSAGGQMIVGLKSDGTVVATGNPYVLETSDVSGWTDIVFIDAGDNHIVGVKEDGTVVAAGPNKYGQCDVGEWTDIVAVSAEAGVTLGLKADGTLVVAGEVGKGLSDISQWEGICDLGVGFNHAIALRRGGRLAAQGIQGVENWQDLVAIDSGRIAVIGLKADGTVVAAGKNDYGQCNVQSWYGWTNIALPGQLKMEDHGKQNSRPTSSEAYAEAETLLANGETAKAAIAFGKLGDYADARQRSFDLWNRLFHKDSIFHINGTFYGLKNNGSIVTAGKDEFAIAGNPDWENTVQLVGGSRYDWNQENTCLLGLRSDGTVMTAGQNEAGQCDVSDWTDIVHLWHEGIWFSENARDAAGLMQKKYLNYAGYTIGLRADGTVRIAGGQAVMPDISGWTDVVDIEVGALLNHNTRTLECRFLVGLRADGTLLVAGNSIPEPLKEAENWTGIADIEVSATVITALRPDGTVMVALDETAEYYRQRPDMHEAIREWKDVAVLLSPTNALSKDGDYLSMDSEEAANIYNDVRIAMRAKWDNIASVADGASIALRADGTVTVAAFSNNPCSKVQGWTDVAAVCGATSNYGGHTIGIRKDGTVLAVGDTEYIDEVAAWTDIKLPN